MPKTTLAKSSKRANLVKTKIGKNGGGLSETSNLLLIGHFLS